MSNSATRAIAASLGTITVAATAVTQVFSAVGKGATMLDVYAADALADQADASKIHRSTYRTNLIRQNALEQDKLELELDAHFAANPGSKDRYDRIESELKALFGDDAKA
jgi:hypothetical protein